MLKSVWVDYLLAEERRFNDISLHNVSSSVLVIKVARPRDRQSEVSQGLRCKNMDEEHSPAQCWHLLANYQAQGCTGKNFANIFEN